MGNIFFGQYFYDDESVDLETFRNQARRYGFDEEKYLASVEKVPRYSRKTAKHTISFHTKLARMISELSLSNCQLSKALRDRKKTEETLRKSEARLIESESHLKIHRHGSGFNMVEGS